MSFVDASSAVLNYFMHISVALLASFTFIVCFEEHRWGTLPFSELQASDWSAKVEAPFPGNRESQSAVSMMNEILSVLMIAMMKNDDVCVCPAVREWGFSAVDPKGSRKHYTPCAIQTHTQELPLSSTKSPSAEGSQTDQSINAKNATLSLRNEDKCRFILV